MRRAALVLALLVLVPASSALASASDVIRDCTDDARLQGRYTQKELRSALAGLPSDIDEYTNCRDVIRAAQLAAANSGGGSGRGGASGGGTGSTPGSGGSGGSGGDSGPSLSGDFGGFPATEGGGAGKDPLAGANGNERRAIEEAQSMGDAPLRIDSLAVTPGQVTRRTSGTVLPVPVVVLLALAAAGLVALAGLDLRRRVVTRRTA